MCVWGYFKKLGIQNLMALRTQHREIKIILWWLASLHSSLNSTFLLNQLNRKRGFDTRKVLTVWYVLFFFSLFTN